MVKCAKCIKIVNKKSPGILCMRCNKWFHGACVSITIEQLTALHQTEAADWKCPTCAMGAASSKPKRISFIMPDPVQDEEPEDEPSPDPAEIINQPAFAKFMDEIRKEIRKVITNELQQSLKFYADKIDEFENKVITYEAKIKSIDNKYTDIKNQQKNTQLHYEALEQKYNTLLQEKWCNYIEICGIKEEEQEDVENIAKNVGKELQQSQNDVVSAYRKLPTKRAGTGAGANNQLAPPVIVVSLKEGCKGKWMTAAKVNRRNSNANNNTEQKPYYLREYLSPTTAFLLYKAKTDLKNTGLCEYVWCQNGLVLARKTDKEKIYSIRIESDIKKLADILKK